MRVNCSEDWVEKRGGVSRVKNGVALWWPKICDKLRVGFMLKPQIPKLKFLRMEEEEEKLEEGVTSLQ